MRIHDDVIKSLISLPFLKGKRETEIPIEQIKKLKDAEKSINSLKWGNYCLDKRGDLTSYLFKFEDEIYSHWNQLIDSADELVIPAIKKELNHLVSSGELTDSMLTTIEFDILGLAVYLTIKAECPSVDSVYYNDIYELYQAGYIPCGFAKGCYKVL